MSYVKQCSKCNEIKEINEFYKKVSSKDGYTGVCKKCITENNKKYKMTCSICGKEYKTHKKDSLYCSLQCAGEGHKNRKEVICNYCGKLIERKRSHAERNENSFCSKSCANKYMSEYMNGENSHNWKNTLITTKCSHCGKEIKVYKYKLEKHKNQFCNRECFRKFNSEFLKGPNNPVYGKKLYSIRGENSPHWKDELTEEDREHNRYDEGYRSFVLGVFRRDNFICQCCGYDKGKILVAHHLNSYNTHKEQRTDINNGITLCNKCHTEFHKKYGYGDNTLEQYNDFIKNKAIPIQASEVHKSN